MSRRPASDANVFGAVKLPARATGFATLDPQRRREMASLGGKAAHRQGRAHEFTPQEARAAALKRQAARAKGAG